MFKEVDVILGPTSPTPAFKLDERTADPLSMYLSDIYTITANLAGIPGHLNPMRINPRQAADRDATLGRTFC